jgi:2-oxoglutarate ferredoxin oxidoreductase subunit alpha
MIVLAPATIPEATELTMLAFDLADRYRGPVLVLVDGMLGQMMEPVEFPEPVDPTTLPAKPWALTGARGRPPNIVTSFFLDPQELSKVNVRRQLRYRQIEQQEVRYEEFETGDATILIAAYGAVARISRTTVKLARNEGIRLGLLRPITLWPFPYAPLRDLSNRVKTILTVEMSAGQMLEDVRLAVVERAETPFYGVMGGIVPTPRDILMEVRKYASYDARDDKSF